MMCPLIQIPADTLSYDTESDHIKLYSTIFHCICVQKLDENFLPENFAKDQDTLIEQSILNFFEQK